jgi:hypothetical protein
MSVGSPAVNVSLRLFPSRQARDHQAKPPARGIFAGVDDGHDLVAFSLRIRPKVQALGHRSALPDFVSAGGEKESNAAGHVWANLRTQRLELLSEQRSQQEGKEDQILEESRRCCQALRGERW